MPYKLFGVCPRGPASEEAAYFDASLNLSVSGLYVLFAQCLRPALSRCLRARCLAMPLARPRYLRVRFVPHWCTCVGVVLCCVLHVVP